MEPMNATSSHSKVRVTASLSAPVFVAGGEISGKMEMDCKTDKGLGINEMMVELVAVQELTSRDHSATSAFMNSKRLFQGPGLPPSNAVFAHPQAGAPPLPPNYHQARKGCTTFFFNFPLPQSSPNSINFGNGLARISYEIRATVGVWWKGERTSVRFNREVVVVECLVDSRIPREPSTLVAEGGKMVVQAQVVGGIGVTGRPSCVELQVKNHSQKKTAGLTVTLTRTLHLPTVGSSRNPFQITDTVVTVPFRGAEYTIGPGVEGVANLVFEIPRTARGVKGGTREKTDDGSHRHIEALFNVQTTVTVTIGMGVGSKDIKVEIPLTILHPLAVPEPVYEPVYDPYQAPVQEYLPLEPPRPHYALPASSSGPPSPASYGMPPVQYQHTATPPHMLPYMPQMPPASMYALQHYVPPPQQYAVSPAPGQQFYFPPPPMQFTEPIARPTSAAAMVSSHSFNDIAPSALPPLPSAPSTHGAGVPAVVGRTEEGKGERASRISLHLKSASRGRSASPTSHRYRISGLPPNPSPLPSAIWGPTRHLTPSPEVLSPRPMLSPKASFSGEPLASPGQSGRVAALEKMVEDEEQTRRKSEERPKEALLVEPAPGPPQEELEAAELAAILDKTLPARPKTFVKPINKAASRTLANVFDEDKPPTVVKSALPPTVPDVPEPITTLANLPPAREKEPSTMLARPDARNQEEELDEPGVLKRTKAMKRASTALVADIPSSQSAAGLDALEKRLLKDVGTRKPAKATLQYLQEMDAKLDEAIRESKKRQEGIIEEETHPPAPVATDETEGIAADRGPEKGPQDAEYALFERRKRRISHDLRVKGMEVDNNQKANQHKGHSKQEEEQIRLRKKAKGRVNAWLGSAEVADPPPLTETRIVEQAYAEIGIPEVEVIERDDKVDPSKIQLPARTSSGFLPIRLPVAPRAQQQLRAVAETAGISPPVQEARPRGVKDWRRFDESKSTPGAGYDVRSARGGKGGKVTSVAALWAEKASNDAQVDPKKSPPPTGGVPLPLMVKIGNDKPAPIESGPKAMVLPKPIVAQSKSPATSPTRAWVKVNKASEAEARERGNLVKAPSVPAKLSSSIASPLLSSTASLARPIKNGPTSPREYVAKSPRLVEMEPVAMKRTNGLSTSVSEPKLAPPSSRPAGGASIAFGQGRLRDLIAKYQQGPTTNP